MGNRDHRHFSPRREPPVKKSMRAIKDKTLNHQFFLVSSHEQTIIYLHSKPFYLNIFNKNVSSHARWARPSNGHAHIDI